MLRIQEIVISPEEKRQNLKYKTNEMKKNLVGTVLLRINFFWLFTHIKFLCLHESSDTLWFYMYPKWVLILNVILGAIGIISGILVIKGLISSSLLFLGITINLIIKML